jgi:hypothetical protein
MMSDVSALRLRQDLRHRFEFDVGPDGLELTKELLRAAYQDERRDYLA